MKNKKMTSTLWLKIQERFYCFIFGYGGAIITSLRAAIRTFKEVYGLIMYGRY
jgi:hypothetical protein